MAAINTDTVRAYSVFTDNNLNTNILFIKSQTPSQIFSLFIHHNNSMFEQHCCTSKRDIEMMLEVNCVPGIVLFDV